MAVSGLSASTTYAASQQQVPPLMPQKRNRHPSIGEVDMQNPTAPTAPSPTSKTGRQIDIIA